MIQNLLTLSLAKYCLPNGFNLEPGTSKLHFSPSICTSNTYHHNLYLDDGTLVNVVPGVSKIHKNQNYDFENRTIATSGNRSFVRKLSGDSVSLISTSGGNIIKNIAGGVEIGTGDTTTTLSSEGISIGGANLIKRTGDTVSIGENSLKLREQSGRQQMC